MEIIIPSSTLSSCDSLHIRDFNKNTGIHTVELKTKSGSIVVDLEALARALRALY